MTDYRTSAAYQRSQKIDPRTGQPVWPLSFLDRPLVRKEAA